ncbi:hypothetical protein S40288_10360 [Stachybotrys chartarum IBT 40288]|nr:hypothetical protein S40288_10360 [Stachybotrys chartarum IBT 40288]
MENPSPSGLIMRDTAIQVFTSDNIPIIKLDDNNYREYEKLVITSNLLFRFTRPPCIVQPESAAHMQSIVNRIREQNLRLTIRCGGHLYAGFSTALEKNNVLMDLRKINKGEVYRTLINRDHIGLIINGGRYPYVGVGGFILSAGLSPFGRTFSMGSNTLLEATMVTAKGEVIEMKKTDDKRSDKGRLFWALQRAGQANFGVVTQIKLKIQHLNSHNG